ncbi:MULTISPECIES: hypothetical protein [unclassified Glutamicibacter]|uniref:hypothetical protein n=1 Tax=Glutamicibacter sp. PS TaxID=3075634 RepID=UPI0028520418|nr:hypothetical protein [Glutamicibacter sp. PS]MDR4534719.1 hypothetical protein [Glutamicibacter sp. PS]
MSEEKPLDPEQQLRALGKAEAEMGRALAYGSRLLGWYCIVLGLTIGALAAILQLNRPDKHVFGFWLVITLYVIVIVVQSVVYGKLYRSLPQGYSTRYRRAFVMSIVFYAISIALLGLELSHWALLVLLGLIVAAPLLITGTKMVRS